MESEREVHVRVELMGDYVAGSWVLRIYGEIPQAIRGRVWFSFGYCGGCVFDLVC